jgi:hypothetical protein
VLGTRSHDTFMLLGSILNCMRRLRSIKRRRPAIKKSCSPGDHKVLWLDVGQDVSCLMDMLNDFEHVTCDGSHVDSVVLDWTFQVCVKEMFLHLLHGKRYESRCNQRSDRQSCVRKTERALSFSTQETHRTCTFLVGSIGLKILSLRLATDTVATAYLELP